MKRKNPAASILDTDGNLKGRGRQIERQARPFEAVSLLGFLDPCSTSSASFVLREFGMQPVQVLLKLLISGYPRLKHI